MIEKFNEDRIKEFELIEKLFINFEQEFYVNLNIKESYLNNFQYILNHLDYSYKNFLLKRFKKINSELIQHIKGFTLLIKNQGIKQIKEEMIQSFINQIKKNNLELEKLIYEIDNYEKTTS